MATSRRGGMSIDFGGMFQRPPPATLAIMVATGVCSIFAALSQGWGDGSASQLLTFSPAAVLHGWVWTPLTYLFVDRPAQNLIWTELILWMFASPVERQWGSRRFAVYVALTGVGAALLTTLLALAFPALALGPYMGPYVLSEAVTLAWVLMNWHATVFLLFFPVPAPVLLVIALVIPFLNIVQGLWQPFVPVLLGMGLGYLVMRRSAGSPRRAYLNFRAWWIDRQLKRRARHLKVVPPPDRFTQKPPDDKWLH